MSQLIVKPVETSREKKQFEELLWQMYRGDPNWIPPLRQNQKELIGFAKHPFYEQNRAQAFLALQDGKPVGRILAILNNAHNERFNEKRGFFGFFESIDDQAVASGLFAAAKQWLVEQGMTAVRGPTNPSMNYECGLLIEGFDRPPTFMMTYNKPYYARLIEACGLAKTQDMYAFYGHLEMLADLDKKVEFVVKEALRRFNLKLRKLNPRKFYDDVRMFLDIYNSSMQGTWGFVALSPAEADHMAASMKYLLVPEMTSIAEVDGKPVGAVFGMLDYNPRIKAIDGKLFPFGWLRLLWNKKAIHKIRLISTNVIPEYQRWGVGLVLLARMLPGALAWGIREAEFSWVLESNHLSYSSLKRGGAVITQTYRMYEGDL